MAITHIQSGSGSVSATQPGYLTALTAAFGSATSAGNLIVVTTITGAIYGSATPPITDAAGNSYTQVEYPSYYNDTYIGATGDVATYCIQVSYSLTTLPNAGTVTATYASNSFKGAARMFIDEYAGIPPSSVLDTHVSVSHDISGGISAPQSLSITPTNSGELVYAVTDCGSTPSGFTAVQDALVTAYPGYYQDHFYESHILSCPAGANVIQSSCGQIGVAVAFNAQTGYFIPRWVSI